MPRAKLVDAPALVKLARDGGYSFKANCHLCEGALIVHGNSRGREDIARPCLNVSGTAECEDCGAHVRIDVVITPLPTRTPGRPWA
jgi:hypothetical protein